MRIIWYILLGCLLVEVSCRRRYVQHKKFNASYDPTKHSNWKLVNHPSCGHSASEGRIIGGKDAELGQFPWLVRIYRSIKGRAPEFDCGGSIINEKYVITAGHCFSKSPSASFVRAGDYNTQTNPDCDESMNICAPPVKDYDIEKVIKHENYGKPETLNNDIALIRIKEKFSFNEFIAPICLPFEKNTNNEYLSGNTFEVAGWGAIRQIENRTEIVNEPSPVLQKLKVPVVENFQCSRMLEIKINASSQICAGGTEGRDACAGDSGGPLMKYTTADNITYSYFLFGIISFGPSICAQKFMPGVYTRIDKYMNWILDRISY